MATGVCPETTCSILLNSRCVFYEGAALPYTGIDTNNSIEESLQKIEDVISGISGGAVWGAITGNIGDQTDLISYLSSTYTPQARVISINGVSQDLSANRSWTTVSSVAALTIGATGTDITSTVANPTTTPVITLNVPTASATNRGALSSTDWSTFNNKQDTITASNGVVKTGNNLTLGGPLTSAVVFTGGQRVTFSPGATNAGFNPGQFAGNPSTPTNGDIWYNSLTNNYRGSKNGVNVSFLTSGNLNENTTVSGTDRSFSFTLTNSALGSAEFNVNSSSNSAYLLTDHGGAIGQHRIRTNSTGVEISLLKGGLNTIFRINDTSGAVFTDQRVGTAGIVYAADYSAGYTIRSLVDKAYVDASIGAIVPGSNTEVIFNNGGVFGADNLFTWNNVNNWLGIGKAIPGRNIDIESSGIAQVRMLSTGTSSVGVSLQRTAGTTSSWDLFAPSGTSNFYISSTSGEVVITSGGNVGLGIDPPAARLHVRGANNLVALLVEDDAGNDILKGEETAGVTVLTFGQSSNFLSSLVSYSTSATFNTTNGLGIGSANANLLYRTLGVTHNTTVAAAIGSGTGIDFYAKTNTGSSYNAARLEAISTNIGAGTEVFDMVFSTSRAGVTPSEAVRFVGSDRGIKQTTLFGTVTYNETGIIVANGGASSSFDIVSSTGSNSFNDAQDLRLLAENGYSVSGNGYGGSVTIQSGQRRAAGSGLDGDILIYANTLGNISLGDPTGSFGSGQRVIFIANDVTNPSTNPTGGIDLYVDAGVLKYRDPSGNTITP